jgi:hypothetical protein
MPPRKCTKTRANLTRPCKRITLPLETATYQAAMQDPQAFREMLDRAIQNDPELFPATISAGYWLHDRRSSQKLAGVGLRRIKLKAPDRQGRAQVFTVAPSSVMPYMTGYTDEVENGLFMRCFGVPFWALARVFGRDEAYWYRLAAQFGRYNLVQTTVKDPEKLPKDLLADEKFANFNGEQVYIATTVGQECVLGASIALVADTDNLKEAYGHFKTEAQQVQPDYAPETVNTDGWSPTQRAWQALFPLIVVIECFLHAYLKIRARCRRTLLSPIAEKVWDLYRATNPQNFREQAADLLNWAQHNVEGTPLAAIHKLAARVERLVLAYEHPQAHRTSNMLDRHMDRMARWLDDGRAFHGHWTSAECNIRSWALLHNFWPYCPRAKIAKVYQSPAHRLNGFVYHENWLHNLLVSTSLSGCSP